MLATIVLATAGPAAADHYPAVPRALQRKDRAVLDGLDRLSYADTQYITLAPDACDCLELTCDEGHFMLTCGGEVEPIGILTASRRTSRSTCLVCGCVGDEGGDLTATPICVGF
jgi:hypothetical protein